MHNNLLWIIKGLGETVKFCTSPRKLYHKIYVYFEVQIVMGLQFISWDGYIRHKNPILLKKTWNKWKYWKHS